LGRAGSKEALGRAAGNEKLSDAPQITLGDAARDDLSTHSISQRLSKIYYSLNVCRFKF
jgi:hypothetical protein